MYTRSTSKEPAASASRPFFAVQRALAPGFFAQSPFAAAPEVLAEAAHAEPPTTHAVQRKRAACGSEKRLLPQLEVGPVDDPLETEADVMADRVVRRQATDIGDDEQPVVPLQARAIAPALQRECTACEAERKIQPQLEAGPIDEPLETEADMMADQVVRRQAIDVHDDEREGTPVQAKSADTVSSSDSASAGFESGLAAASGSGAPLAAHTRDRMEEAFGVDFSDVRVHTGTAAAAMNDQIGARAFTYGTDIHFNRGEFAPGTEQGMRLLAHELTHVVQQNSSVRRSPRRIQAKLLVFGPASGMPKGSLIHNEGLLPGFKAAGLNPGLWVEPAVPGANVKTVGRGLTGYPDFYRADEPNAVPIGINEGLVKGFTGLPKASAMAAPKPPVTPGGSVRDLDDAPTKIELGDVKPGHSGEESLGKQQLKNYAEGITNTAKAVNNYQKLHGHPGGWYPRAGFMKKLDVPDKLASSSAKGVAYGPLAVWEWLGVWKRRSSTAMKGSIVVYKSSVEGIWAYEWLPASVPEGAGTDPKVKKVLERLEKDVKPRLHSTKKPAPKRQASSAAATKSVRGFTVRRLQRKPKPHEKFDEQGWLRAYNPWHDDAEKALAEPETRENEAVLDALAGAQQRAGSHVRIPESVSERTHEFATVRHWVRYGKLYGWFRKTFDRVYVKLAGFAQKVKDKVKKLSQSRSGGGFGNWIKAAALALFKVAKKLGAWAISMIVDKLLDSLQEGVINIVKQLAEAATPESVKSKIEEVEELKAQFEQMLQEAQEKLEERLFGNKLEFFSKLDRFMEIANTVSTIVSVVRWGIRVVACASPPLLGCLWNLAVAALEFAFAKLMETCWFSAKVFGWVKDSGIQAILDFPTQVAQAIATKANEVLRLPEGIGPLFATSTTIDHNDFNIDCKAGGGGDGDGGEAGPEPTEEQKALVDLARQVDPAKLEAFLEMAAKRAADYNVVLDAERIRKLAPLINSLSVEQMKKLAENQPTEGVSVPVEEFLKDLATLTPAERERKAARNIDYAKAQRSNVSYERNEIGWKPTLFVAPAAGITSDSPAFADAIYDIQKILSIKADGMAGPRTTKLFYEQNNVPKDTAYRNAAGIVEREEQARAERAEEREAILALLRDEKVRSAMEASFPSGEQLKKDLAGLNWDAVADDSARFLEVNGRPVVMIKTDAGHRVGGYFHYVQREFGGVTMPMVVKVGPLHAIDEIPTREFIDFLFYDRHRRPTFYIQALSPQKKGSFFALGPSFLFAAFVRLE